MSEMAQMKENPFPLATSELQFMSTQMQGRYEDQERKEVELSKLRQFRHLNETSINTPIGQDKTKGKKKPRTNARGKTRKITSISAFVRETLGTKKVSDTQSVLEYFMNDQQKFDMFMSKLKSATSPHLLSSKSHGQSWALFSADEWQSFVERIQLRFPYLVKRHKKSLKVIARRLEDLRETEENSARDGGSNMWLQASRQPSDNLTCEDIKWLYDLDDEQLVNESSIAYPNDSEDGPMSYTFSQVLEANDVQADNEQKDAVHDVDENLINSGVEGDANEILTNLTCPKFSSEYVDDSESGLESLSGSELMSCSVDTSKPFDVKCSTTSNQDRPSTYSGVTSHQIVENPETPDSTTSLSFISSCELEAPIKELPDKRSSESPSQYRLSDKAIDSEFYSPIKSLVGDFQESPSHWSNELHVHSSPISPVQRSSVILEGSTKGRNGNFAFDEIVDDKHDSNEDDTYSTADTTIRSRDHNSQELTPSDLSNYISGSFTEERHRVVVYGSVELNQNDHHGREVTLRRINPPKCTLDIIEDSEDEDEDKGVTYIEIIKHIDELRGGSREKPDKTTSVLQVPSSP